MLHYRERLWPSLWVLVSSALIIPASLLVFLPISRTAGIVCAAVLYAGCVAVLVGTSPVIVVSSVEIVAGRARLPLEFAGPATAYYGPEATLERGRNLDARAWLVIRGWIAPVVKIVVLDTADPAPYWLVSTRHPDRVVDAVGKAKAAAENGSR